MSSVVTQKGAHISATVPEPEQNILVPIRYDRIPRCEVTCCSGGTKKRRATAVGLRGSRSTQHTWKEKLEARIISKGDGCWEAAGHRLPNGVVQISSGGVGPNRIVKLAHRLSWELANGRLIPDGYVIAHTCDNPPCVRPDHLVLTTQEENVHDSVRKGRYKTWGHQKLNQTQVLAIREASALGEHQRVIAARFGIARNTVSGIVNHKTWAHLTKPVDGPQPALILESVPYVHLEIRGEVG